MIIVLSWYDWNMIIVGKGMSFTGSVIVLFIVMVIVGRSGFWIGSLDSVPASS